MNMNSFPTLFAATFAIHFFTVEAQVLLPEASLRVKVVDEGGQAIAGAKVGIDDDVYRKPPSGNGISNTDGFHSAQLRTMGSLFFGARMEGYYSAGGEYVFHKGAMDRDSSAWATNRWQPWTPTVEVVLKRKRHPVAMYAKWIGIESPAPGKAIGFDLEVGDWVAPVGKGTSADLIFDGRGAIKDDSFRLDWTFSHPGDGIQIVAHPAANVRSELRSPTEAPSSGYKSKITFDGKRVIGVNGLPDERPECFLIRVRTVLDPKGNIVSCNYGKIYTSSAFRVALYLNPTPNSRSLEFDPQLNLFPKMFGGLIINDP